MNIVGYARVSSQEQIKNYSISNQIDKCKEYCIRENHTLLRIFTDKGKSAKTLNRPALIDLLDFCRNNKTKVDGVLIYKIDRLSRDTFEYLEVKRRLAKLGISIISITEPTDNSPTGEFLETLMAAQARLDNAIKSDRTKDGMTKRLETGLPTNPLPVGYKYVPGPNDKNVPDVDEPKFTIMRNAGLEYTKGIYTFNEIAEIMNKEGFETLRGSKASNQFVSGFLTNRFYMGSLVSKVRGKEYKGVHQPMFSEEEWTRIQLVRSGKAKSYIPHKRNNPDFPLRHFSSCSKCNQPLTGAWSKGNGGRYPYYFCNNHGPSVPKDQFEQEFEEILKEITPTQETVREFTKILRSKYDKKFTELSGRSKKHEDELLKLKELQNKLIQKNLEGLYDDKLFAEQNAKIEDQILEQNILLSETKIDKLDVATICEFAEEFLQDLNKTWRVADLCTKQRLQKLIFPDGILYTFPGFRTNSISPIFNILGDIGDKSNHLG